MRPERCTLLLPLLLAACGEEPAPQEPPPVRTGRPAATEKLLEVDGLVVTFGDLDPFVAYFDGVYPNYSYKSKVRTVLDDHWLPVVLARRAFAERREELRRRAASLAEVADNVYDLESRGADLGGSRSERLLFRKEVELPVAAWLFEPTRQGRVSGPLEVPQGFKVVAAHELVPAAVAADDRVDVYQVPFFVDDMKGFMDWLTAEKERVANKVTYVHPDFTDVLPKWLKAP